jgi:biotin-dependent carboxylase-like uncharacterized protein
MKYSVPPSGAMDQYSYRIGNQLIGNPDGAASLEIFLAGLQIEVLKPVTAVITGADFSPHINNEPVAIWAPLSLEIGDVIQFKKRISGFWTYLAVRGGIRRTRVLGSMSTFLRGKIGKPLRDGECLEIGDPELSDVIHMKTLSEEYLPDFNNKAPIRVLPGPQHNYYSQEGISTFYHSTYRVTSESDRMGYRLSGPPVEIAKGPGIITEPIPRGAIQVPGDGQPIVLLRDAPVTGGYGKIAVVISADLDRFVQRVPGSTDGVQFEKTSRRRALELWFEKEKQMEAIKRVIRAH